MLNKARQKQQWNGRLGGTWVYCLHRKSARQSVTEDRELQLLQVCLKFFLNLFVIYPQIFSPLKKFSIFFCLSFCIFRRLVLIIFWYSSLRKLSPHSYNECTWREKGAHEAGQQTQRQETEVVEEIYKAEGKCGNTYL